MSGMALTHGGNCPHCGQRMLTRHGAKLSPKLADIFDLIEHSGERGVPMDILVDVFYSGKPRRDAENCVRVNINHINDLFLATDVRVRNNGKSTPYKVVRE